MTRGQTQPVEQLSTLELLKVMRGAVVAFTDIYQDLEQFTRKLEQVHVELNARLDRDELIAGSPADHTDAAFALLQEQNRALANRVNALLVENTTLKTRDHGGQNQSAPLPPNPASRPKPPRPRSRSRVKTPDGPWLAYRDHMPEGNRRLPPYGAGPYERKVLDIIGACVGDPAGGPIGYRCRQAVADLNDRGYRTRQGNPWNLAGVNRMYYEHLKDDHDDHPRPRNDGQAGGQGPELPPQLPAQTDQRGGVDEAAAPPPLPDHAQPRRGPGEEEDLGALTGEPESSAR